MRVRAAGDPNTIGEAITEGKGSRTGGFVGSDAMKAVARGSVPYPTATCFAVLEPLAVDAEPEEGTRSSSLRFDESRGDTWPALADTEDAILGELVFAKAHTGAHTGSVRALCDRSG